LLPDALTLDGDLTPASRAPGVHGLIELAHVSQAIGILIDRGHLPDDARAELHRLANHAETTVHIAARHLIASTLGSPSPGGLAG
jgi:hypothetical protein